VRPGVAIVGAGPSGAAAALALARAGVPVVIYERERWPRVKVCGDGLTPASVAELASLGLGRPSGPRLTGTLVSDPAEQTFIGGWPAASPDGTTEPRVRSDARLLAAAVAAGARFEPGVTVRAVASAALELEASGRRTTAPRTATIVLADGATGGLARELGFPGHRLRLAAYRGYAALHAPLGPEYQVHYARDFLPGYAWLFPSETGRVNVGAVLGGRGDVRAALRAWLGRSAIARAALGSDSRLEDGRGGVIPVGRATRSRGDVHLLGDAAGVADPLSAEGVSQAMATGRLFATAWLDANGEPHGTAAAYARSLAAFDANNREALRMRRLFGWLADPLVALAARRPELADHVVATGYFAKTDAAWFWGTFGAALRARRPVRHGERASR